MARALIDNPVSKAPGFQLGNVFVMAGVPSIMRGMLQDIGHRIEGGAIVSSRTVRAKGVPEGDIADALGELEKRDQRGCVVRLVSVVHARRALACISSRVRLIRSRSKKRCRISCK